MICCYCDRTLSCGGCGMEQPDDTPWQPIETKPKDHFQVLVWGPYGHRVAFWDVTWTWWTPDGADPIDWAPTHWMPLPKRPILLKTAEGEQK